MRKDEDFKDVTLVCEGDKLVRAHRVVLASYSPFFKAAFARKKQSKQRKIFLKGIGAKDMASVLDFIYYGEVTMARDDVEEFLAVAEDLKVTGIVDGTTNNEENLEKTSNIDIIHSKNTNDLLKSVGHNFEEIETGLLTLEGTKKPLSSSSPNTSIVESEHYIKKVEEVKTTNITEQLCSVKVVEERIIHETQGKVFKNDGNEMEHKKMSRKEMKHILALSHKKSQNEVDKFPGTMVPQDVLVKENDEVKDLVSQIDSMMMKQDGLWICKKCGKKRKDKHRIIVHVEGIHISGFYHPCSLCGKSLTSRTSLASHVRKFHTKVES